MWDAVLCDESVDANCEFFKNNILLTVSTKFTPKAVKKPYSNKPSWRTTQISKVVKKSINCIHNKFTRSDADYAVYAPKRNL